MRIQIYCDRRGEYRWRLIAANGNILADSGEGYRRRRTCVQMAGKLFPKVRMVV